MVHFRYLYEQAIHARYQRGGFEYRPPDGPVKRGTKRNTVDTTKKYYERLSLAYFQQNVNIMGKPNKSYNTQLP